jgi:DNA polymerase
MYLKNLAKKWDKMQIEFGDKEFNSIYGYGEINSPDIMLIFMNPTARNIASHKEWNGIKAPWIGTKGVWKMLHELNLFTDNKLIKEILEKKGVDWDTELAKSVYEAVQVRSIYITNIAKCTLSDARAVKDSIYREYLPTTYQEISEVNPIHVISFGNQVSSILLNKKLSVSNYHDNLNEDLNIGNNAYKVYPTYYPVGQGRRNMPKAKARIKSILGI